MRIYFELPEDTDKDRLLGALRELATTVEIAGIGFDPWSEWTFAQALKAAGFPADRITEERAFHRATAPIKLVGEWPKARKSS